MATANINLETGINYGAVSGKNLHSDVIDCLFNGINVDEAEATLAKAKELADKDIELFDDELNPSFDLLAKKDAADKILEKIKDYIDNKPTKITCERSDEHELLMSECANFIGDHDIDIEVEMAFSEFNESNIVGVYEGVHYTLVYLGGAITIIVEESQVKGKYAPCSPCLPNCGDLDTPDEDGIECYTVPADWFDSEE